MAAPLSNEQVLQMELDRVSVEARAFEGAYKKTKTERDKLLDELQDANKHIRYTIQFNKGTLHISPMHDTEVTSGRLRSGAT